MLSKDLLNQHSIGRTENIKGTCMKQTVQLLVQLSPTSVHILHAWMLHHLVFLACSHVLCDIAVLY